MGIFDFLKGADINSGLKEYEQTEGALLLDVRTPAEYREGRIPGSKNIPLDELGNIASLVPEKDRPLFLYCYSGARSRQAVALLQSMGYSRVKNLGGIAAYRGKVEE